MNVRMCKPYFPPGTLDAVGDVLDSGWVAGGEKADEFAEMVAKIEGYDYGVATSSCSTALLAALHTYPFWDKDTIRIPHITFPATLTQVLAAGYEPLITDRDFDMGVDVLGLKVGDREWPIGDCACSLGSVADTSVPPEIACYSFHARKPVSTGEGGCLCTNNKRLYDRARNIIYHGKRTGFDFGYNFRLSDIQAAIGIVQLNKFDFILSRRHYLAHKYNRYLPDGVSVWGQEGRDVNYDYNYQSFVVMVPGSSLDVSDILDNLKIRGVECCQGTSRLHKMANYEDYIDPWAEFTDYNFVTLPFYIGLDEGEIRYVCNVLEDALS